MEKQAETIAKILVDTPTENRGDLLKMVSEILISKTQGFTASVINHASRLYGTSDIRD